MSSWDAQRAKSRYPHRTRWSLIPALSLVLIVAPRAEAQPRMPTHVACVGDSITEGFGASGPTKYYPAQLQGLLGAGVQVHNFGHSGTTMLGPGYGDSPYVQTYEYTAASDFVSKAGANAVVSVIIIFGANDSKPNNWDPTGKPKNDQQFLTDYRAMVDHFLGLPTKPTVYVALPLATGNNPCCTIRGDVIHDQEIPLIKQLAMEKRVPIIDLNTPTLNHPEYFGDGVHPTDAGYLILAQLVQKGFAREPAVSIKMPTAGQMVGLGPLALDAGSADGTVDFTSVEFFEGTTSLGKAMATPFKVNWTPAAGNHSITATATDTTRASGTSMAVSFTVSSDVSQSGGAGGSGGGGAGSGGLTANGGVGAGGDAAAGSASTLGGAPQAGASATSGAGAPAGLPVSGAAGTGTTMSPANPTNSSSCSLRVAGAAQNRSAGWPLLGLLLLGARARRRRLLRS